VKEVNQLVCIKTTWRCGGTDGLENLCDYSYTEEGEHAAMKQLQVIFFLSLPGKVYAKCFEKRCHEMIDPML